MFTLRGQVVLVAHERGRSN